MKKQLERDSVELKRMRTLFAAFLKTQSNKEEDMDEWYTTPFYFADGTIKKFLDWYKKLRYNKASSMEQIETEGSLSFGYQPKRKKK